MDCDKSYFENLKAPEIYERYEKQPLICAKGYDQVKLSRSLNDKLNVFSIRINECVNCSKEDNYWDTKYLSNLVFETKIVSQKINFETNKPFPYVEWLSSRKFEAYI